MKDFEDKVADFKIATTGAAYFTDNFTGNEFCANGLTKQQADKFAAENNLTLVKWKPGESCGR
ncbi:hypothetical protein [Mucilaginibacter phyllosphaerae]|uniref:Uncharacterized protein n=1 Tax=Mucilaginibacter phyllosphaerae TaxID=1812349 RepID=A0A4Y8AFC9_9SPHI|nr:hypothetical protein [Mucilaginibacter phyllosphaerae]MBB3968893.1 hypothetical protein [Mucilaginibacter phyllosphaerae]TEW67478.1 hypothetical protein E2R65_05685 [Mucilaginibacter phyllosphaerae]GGH13254.1 hypothetical protein GCM10007352_20590 [Mucilaginibacter phyllosphaerae]